MSPVMCAAPGAQAKPAISAAPAPSLGKLVPRASKLVHPQLSQRAPQLGAEPARPAKRIKIIIRSQGGPRAKAALRQVLSSPEPLQRLQRLGVYRSLASVPAQARPLGETGSEVSSDESSIADSDLEANSPGAAGQTNTDLLDDLLPVSEVDPPAQLPRLLAGPSGVPFCVVDKGGQAGAESFDDFRFRSAAGTKRRS